MVTKGFLRSILREEKFLIHRDNFKASKITQFDKLSVKQLYSRIQADPELLKYLTDSYPKGRQCDRTYMFNVWNTIRPEQVKALRELANT